MTPTHLSCSRGRTRVPESGHSAKEHTAGQRQRASRARPIPAQRNVLVGIKCGVTPFSERWFPPAGSHPSHSPRVVYRSCQIKYARSEIAKRVPEEAPSCWFFAIETRNAMWHLLQTPMMHARMSLTFPPATSLHPIPFLQTLRPRSTFLSPIFRIIFVF